MDLSKLHLHWRPRKRGKKVYKSFSLARAYWQDGKNRKEIVLKLGVLSEEEAERWRVTLKAFKNPNMPIGVNQDNLIVMSNRAYLDVAVLLETWNLWDLNDVFDTNDDPSEREVPLSSLAAILAINRCIDPASKSQVSTWVRKTSLPLLQHVFAEEINASRIFRELASIEACKDRLCRHLYEKMLERFPEAMKELFYDLSSTTFTGSRCLLVKWGHCKEGYENHIVLALIVNAQGLPIYWEVLEGGTADATTITWLLAQLREKFPSTIAIPTMVFDRGMVSEDNLTLLEEAQIKYISAMDKNQLEGITKVDFLAFAKMTPDDVEDKITEHTDFAKLGDLNTYCKEINVEGTRRYVLCFNAQLFKDQRNAREEQLGRLASFISEQNKALLYAQKDRSKTATKEKFDAWLRKAGLQGFVNVELDEKYVPKKTTRMLKAILTYQSRFFIDESKKLEAGRLDGFWLLVTNHAEKKDGRFIQDTESVVRPYREKVVIESSFRDIKSFIEISPVHVWKTEHVRAHYTICVLAHLLDRTISLALHAKPGQATKEIVSHEKLYEEFAECRLNHMKTSPKQNSYRLTEPTDKHKELLERLGMQHLIGDAALKALTVHQN